MTMEDLEITSQDIPGWLVASDERVTVAIDINLTEDLRSKKELQENLSIEFRTFRKDELVWRSQTASSLQDRLQHEGINDRN